MKIAYFGAISSVLFCFSLQASLVGIHDDSGTNKFLGSTISACSKNGSGCNTGDVTTSSIYVDQRQTLDGILGINFFQHQDRVIYLYNEFGYWSAQRVQYGNQIGSSSVYTNQDDKLAQDVVAKFPGAGVYIIAISAVPGFVNRVGKNLACPSGQMKVAAILFYDDGNGLQPLSASSIAVGQNDTFSLYISPNQKGAIRLPSGVTAFSGALTTSSSGSVDFQALEITVVHSTPPDTSSGKESKGSSGSKTAASSPKSSNDLAPSISLGNPLNLGSSPQSISLRKS